VPRNVIDHARNPHMLDPTREWYGIEVEAEGLTVGQAARMRWSPGFSELWGYHEDGSLRNGIEFVSRPLSTDQVPQAIERLWPGVVPRHAAPSGRTGVHIHASCLGLNTDHVLKIARYYALLEPVMFSIAGASREENIFCIPWYRGDDEAKRVYGVLSNEQAASKHRTAMFVHRRPPTCKYSALNITPLVNFGTIEFRHAPTYDNREDATAWYNAVRAIYLTHKRKEDPLEFWRESGPEAVAAAVFGEDVASRHVNLSALIDEYDTERTALLLYPKKAVVSKEWGTPPMLKVKPKASAPREEPDLDEYDSPAAQLRRAVASARVQAAQANRMREQARFVPEDVLRWYNTTPGEVVARTAHPAAATTSIVIDEEDNGDWMGPDDGPEYEPTDPNDPE
jgi:hypothetical protein